MSEKYKTYTGGVFQVTLTVVDWIHVFTQDKYCDVIIQNLNYCIENKGLRVFVYCIIPSHIHLIASSIQKPLSHLIRDFKSHTSKRIIDLIRGNHNDRRKHWILSSFRRSAEKRKSNSAYQFWQYGNHPVDLSNSHFFTQRLKYIYNNPAKAGLVNESEKYKYCSFYPGQKVKLENYCICTRQNLAQVGGCLSSYWCKVSTRYLPCSKLQMNWREVSPRDLSFTWYQVPSCDHSFIPASGCTS